MTFWVGFSIGSGLSIVAVTIFFMWLLRVVVRRSKSEMMATEKRYKSAEEYEKKLVESRVETNELLGQLVDKISNLK